MKLQGEEIHIFVPGFTLEIGKAVLNWVCLKSNCTTYKTSFYYLFKEVISFFLFLLKLFFNWSSCLGRVSCTCLSSWNRIWNSIRFVQEEFWDNGILIWNLLPWFIKSQYSFLLSYLITLNRRPFMLLFQLCKISLLSSFLSFLFCLRLVISHITNQSILMA